MYLKQNQAISQPPKKKFMKKYIQFIFLFAPMVSLAQQIDRSKAPAPGKAPVIQVGTPASFELANGLKVFVVKNNPSYISLFDRLPKAW